jgi:hypothetical protein
MRYQDKKHSPDQKSNRDLEGDLESCTWDKRRSPDQKCSRDLEGDLKSCSWNKRYRRNGEGDLERHHVVQILLHRPHQQMTPWNK